MAEVGGYGCTCAGADASTVEVKVFKGRKIQAGIFLEKVIEELSDFRVTEFGLVKIERCEVG